MGKGEGRGWMEWNGCRRGRWRAGGRELMRVGEGWGEKGGREVDREQ